MHHMHHMQVSKPELTAEQKATIRQTVVRELRPLSTFKKAQSHNGVIQYSPQPVKPPARAPSVDFNMSYVSSTPDAARPSLLPDSYASWAANQDPSAKSGWGPTRQPSSQRASMDSVCSSEIPEGSPGIVWAEQRQPKRASQESLRSSFNAEHAVRAEHAGPGAPAVAPGWTPFAQNNQRLSQDSSSHSGENNVCTLPVLFSLSASSMVLAVTHSILIVTV